MKNLILILPVAIGLVATVITSEVRTPATYGSTSGAMVYQAQAAPTPTPDPTGPGVVPLKA